MPSVKDLTNASCRGSNSGSQCQGSVGATPSSPNNYYMRHIGSGFFTEWGRMSDYSGLGFVFWGYWTSDPYNGTEQFIVNSGNGDMNSYGTRNTALGLCAHP